MQLTAVASEDPLVISDTKMQKPKTEEWRSNYWTNIKNLVFIDALFAAAGVSWSTLFIRRRADAGPAAIHHHALTCNMPCRI
jgi:hypothetical protein